VKNRRQQIGRNDLTKVMGEASLASSEWHIENVRPALVSSSIYNRIPKHNNSIQIITTGKIYVPNEELFHLYKWSLGSWYMEPVNALPSDLIDKVRRLLEPEAQMIESPIELGEIH
jgi:hypothetical protein